MADSDPMRIAYEENKIQAYKAIERHNSFHIENVKGSFLFASEAFKAVLIINGAGLTAIGTLASTTKKTSLYLPSAFSFFIGMALGCLALIAGYMAQYFYTQASGNNRYTLEHPFVVQTDQSNRFLSFGESAHFIAFIFVIISFILFFVGCVFLWNII